MKQIWPDYSYSPTTNVLTLTGLNIDRDQLLLVSAPERGRIMYNFADSAVTASAFTAGANTALTLVATTAGLTTTASLVIYYDDQLQSTSITVANFPATQPVSIASVTIGNSVTIGSLPAISGTVTVGNSVTIGSLPAISGTVTIGAGTAQIGSVIVDGLPEVQVEGTVQVSISSVTVGNSVTIGSLPAISGTVTANLASVVTADIYNVAQSVRVMGTGNDGVILQGIDSGDTSRNISEGGGIPVFPRDANFPISGTVTAVNHQGTSVTTSNFTSTTASTTLASANASREVLTIFNEGAGNLHICAGATCTTIAYQVRLSAGDYYEVPLNQTSLTHSAVFATAGTARVTEIS